MGGFVSIYIFREKCKREQEQEELQLTLKDKEVEIEVLREVQQWIHIIVWMYSLIMLLNMCPCICPYMVMGMSLICRS